MKMSYEKAIEELEAIGDELESGELSLDKALEKYARAVELIKACRETLDSAKKKMKILVDGADGEKVEAPFDPEEFRA